MSENKLPYVSVTAYDEDGIEVTETISIEMKTVADAINLWQRIRELARLAGLQEN